MPLQNLYTIGRGTRNTFIQQNENNYFKIEIISIGFVRVQNGGFSIKGVRFITLKLCGIYLTYRGSYMSAHVLLNLLNEFGKRDKMRGLPSILSLFRNEFNKFNNTRARMLDSIYHMTNSLKSHS